MRPSNVPPASGSPPPCSQPRARWKLLLATAALGAALFAGTGAATGAPEDGVAPRVICRYDEHPVRKGLPSAPTNLVGGDDGVLMARWDPSLEAVFLERADTGDRHGGSATPRPALKRGSIKALVETDAGFAVLFSGRAADGKTEWQLVHFDRAGIPDYETTPVQGPSAGAVLVEVIQAAGRWVLLYVQGESWEMLVLDGDGRRAGPPIPLSRGFDAAARIGEPDSPQVAILAPLEDRDEVVNTPSLLQVFDVTRLEFNGDISELDRHVVAAAPAGDGAVLITTRIEGHREVMESAALRPDGVMRKWRRLRASKPGEFFAEVSLVADSGVPLALTYYTARKSGMGFEDTPTTFVARLRDDGRLLGKPASRFAGPHPFATGATEHDVFVLADRGLYKVTCR